MNLAINGLGRIGRNVFKVALERPGMEITAVNDVADPQLLAYLLQHDSLYGVYNRDVRAENGMLCIDDKKIPFLSCANPEELPWLSMGVDVVVDTTTASFANHIKAGAQRVLATDLPEDGIDKIIISGVNDEQIEEDDKILSTAGGTENALAPLIKILHQSFTIKEGFFTALHALTNNQTLLDKPNSDFRRSRAAGFNIVPSERRFSQVFDRVFPELEGKLDGTVMNVPVPIGSALELVLRLENVRGREELNAAVREASQKDMKGVIEYAQAPLVSSDLRGNSHSVVFDAGATMVNENLSSADGLVKITSWYDNEFGYASRIVDLSLKLSGKP